MDKINLGARHFLYPQPAVLAGANVNGKPNYLTIAWSGIMQASPALIYVSIRKQRYTLPGIEENKSFSVNVPSAEQVVQVDYCGIRSGHKIDKSEIFTTFYGKLENAPMIEECPINMECRLVKTIDFEGTHMICVGEIVATYADEKYLTNGEPDVSKVNPLIFTTDGKYWAFGEEVGKAFEIGKEFENGQ
ncbi:MAG: flavin reductase family protein [bacterium]